MIKAYFSQAYGYSFVVLFPFVSRLQARLSPLILPGHFIFEKCFDREEC